MTRTGGRYRIVLVTCASLAEARKIARSVVGKKLAACANIIPRIESIYRWKGQIEQSREVLMILKTTASRLRPLEREVKRIHTYEVPEFIALSVASGSPDYLQWLKQNTR